MTSTFVNVHLTTVKSIMWYASFCFVMDDPWLTSANNNCLSRVCILGIIALTDLWLFATAVLGVVILSVRPSATHVDCDKTRCTADILIPHERAISLLLWHQQWLVGTPPLPLKSALKVTQSLQKMPTSTAFCYVLTVRDSEISSIMTNIKLTTGFPTSYRWNAYVTPKSRKGGSKSGFFAFFWIKVNFNWVRESEHSSVEHNKQDLQPLTGMPRHQYVQDRQSTVL